MNDDNKHAYAGTTDSYARHSGNIPGTFWNHSGNIRGTFGEHSGNIQYCKKEGGVVQAYLKLQASHGTFREHSGIIRGIFGEHSGNI
jgi:hypothetical protein